MGLLSRILYPDGSNGHEFVDIGLKVNWATMNIGARASYECGTHLPWGYIRHNKEPHAQYNTQAGGDYITTLLAEDDIVHHQMGGKWRMPTMEEAKELLHQCQWQKVIINHAIYCFRITGVNNNHIFLPLNGECGDSVYWTSSLNPNNSWAYCLRAQDGCGQYPKPQIMGYLRSVKCMVRGVLPKQ